MNNYLNGDDMWPYVTMWEYEERIIPLQKIVDIFHESCNQKLKCYILTSPLDEERFSVLKAHDNLDFHWVESLEAYSAARKTYLHEKVENQKEHAI